MFTELAVKLNNLNEKILKWAIFKPKPRKSQKTNELFGSKKVRIKIVKIVKNLQRSDCATDCGK